MDFYSVQKIKKARKEHKCECCDTPILKNEPYEYHAGKYKGNFFSFKICPVCSKILGYYTYDLGHMEFNISEIIGDLWHDDKVYELLLQIKHPSEHVKSSIESYIELQEERAVNNGL